MVPGQPGAQIEGLGKALMPHPLDTNGGPQLLLPATLNGLKPVPLQLHSITQDVCHRSHRVEPHVITFDPVQLLPFHVSTIVPVQAVEVA